MSAQYHNGHWYGGGQDVDIQSDPTATSFDPNKVPTGATAQSVLNSKIHIYENLSFVFNNSQSALLAISDIDSNLVNAKALLAFCTNAGTPLAAVINMAKTHVAVQIPSGTITVTMPVNLIAFY